MAVAPFSTSTLFQNGWVDRAHIHFSVTSGVDWRNTVDHDEYGAAAEGFRPTLLLVCVPGARPGTSRARISVTSVLTVMSLSSSVFRVITVTEVSAGWHATGLRAALTRSPIHSRLPRRKPQGIGAHHGRCWRNDDAPSVRTHDVSCQGDSTYPMACSPLSRPVSRRRTLPQMGDTAVIESGERFGAARSPGQPGLFTRSTGSRKLGDLSGGHWISRLVKRRAHFGVELAGLVDEICIGGDARCDAILPPRLPSRYAGAFYPEHDVGEAILKVIVCRPYRISALYSSLRQP